ncbi:hypothetical protein [Devosia sp.]
MTRKIKMPMRWLSVPTAIAMFLASSFSVSSMEWQQGMNTSNLRGSFFASCGECRVDENGYLICRCVDQGGRMGGVSDVRLTYCDRESGPFNYNGRLSCAPILNGSWYRSCNRGSVGGNTLVTTCLPNNKITSMNLDTCPSMDIENNNGQLRCRQ